MYYHLYFHRFTDLKLENKTDLQVNKNVFSSQFIKHRFVLILIPDT